ncbi:nucleotide-diphospho-sugar transferase [Aspergillus avenaceus]|uniref:Nucleotide-diphospho-sugar transferase n=1 Tax=Aspergillus avenaceus TaxID=36643 RepID=A0A5N6U6V2_ASPAV|nr:nucleotide-diphospho-sugar transferase [Aspergillus avenaceus]
MLSDPAFGCLSRRRGQVILAASVFLLLLFYPFRSTIVPSVATSSSPSHARTLSARTLLTRPLSRDVTTIPKIIHQTWFPAGSNMSERAQVWVQGLREQNPDWEYVLWDDETNRMLVEQHFPWFLEAYNGLPKEILRADVVRNLYMYIFGGMYMDVDTEALRPVAPLFAGHETALAAHEDTLSSAPFPQKSTMQRAFLGRMAHTVDILGSAAVPNGWMASPPGHPFWLLPVLNVLENPEGTGDGSVEGLTGPGALGLMIKKYWDSFKNDSLRQHACKTIQKREPSWRLFCDESENLKGESLKDALVLLPEKQVYPFSWVDDREHADVCEAAWENPTFNPEECKRRIDVEAWPSYFITYCTHSW